MSNEFKDIGKVGTVTNTADERTTQLNVLLYGSSGVGKTSMSVSMPGNKFILMFEPGGADTIPDRYLKDGSVTIKDYSGDRFQNVVKEFSTNDPLQLAKILEANPQIDSVIIDSLTSCDEMTFWDSIDFQANRTKSGEAPTRDAPGIASYGTANNRTMWLVSSIMRSCMMFKKHLLIITHDKQDTDESTKSVFTTLALRGKLTAELPKKFSEVWYLEDNGQGKPRTILMRRSKMVTPCKSRMFDTEGQTRQAVTYDLRTGKGVGINDLYDKWLKGGREKLTPTINL